MNEKEIQTNQTEFGNLEPILESRPEYEMDSSEKVKPGVPKKAMYAGIAFLSILLALVIGIFLLVSPRPEVTEIIPSPSPITLEPVAVGELEQVFRDLQADLKASDPTIPDLLLPPVEVDIYIDEPSRR